MLHIGPVRQEKVSLPVDELLGETGGWAEGSDGGGEWKQLPVLRSSSNTSMMIASSSKLLAVPFLYQARCSDVDENSSKMIL